MDPDVTLGIAINRTRPMNERLTAIHDLRDWLDRGGFRPDATCPHEAAVRTLELAATYDWREDLSARLLLIDAATPPPSQ